MHALIFTVVRWPGFKDHSGAVPYVAYAVRETEGIGLGKIDTMLYIIAAKAQKDCPDRGGRQPAR